MSRNKEIDSAQMVAALKETLTVEDAGRLLGCSAPSFRYRAKEDDSIALAIKEQKDLKEASIAEALMVHKGILSKVAETLGFSSGMAVDTISQGVPTLRRSLTRLGMGLSI